MHQNPLEKGMQITCFLDADHAGDMVTRHSHTGILIYLNHAPISWHSKKQNSVKTSMFRLEFMALKAAIEQIKALCLQTMHDGHSNQRTHTCP